TPQGRDIARHAAPLSRRSSRGRTLSRRSGRQERRVRPDRQIAEAEQGHRPCQPAIGRTGRLDESNRKWIGRPERQNPCRLRHVVKPHFEWNPEPRSSAVDGSEKHVNSLGAKLDGVGKCGVPLEPDLPTRLKTQFGELGWEILRHTVDRVALLWL